MKLLSELNEAGTTLVMVTPSPYDAGFAPRTVNLFDGKIVTENIREQFNVPPGSSLIRHGCYERSVSVNQQLILSDFSNASPDVPYEHNDNFCGRRQLPA